MFIMLTVAAICAVVVIAALLAAMCRQPKTATLWFLSDDILLCFVAPAMIALSAFGIISAGWRFTHGGLGAVSIEAWIGSAITLAAAIGLWIVGRRKIRAYGTN